MLSSSGYFYLKLAYHTCIKFLKSRRNSLMMKNKVTYDRYECTKNKWKIIFLGQKYDFCSVFVSLLFTLIDIETSQ